MKILCLGVAQIDSLLRISRHIVAFNHRRAVPSFQFSCWHRFNLVGIPTKVKSNPTLQDKLTRTEKGTNVVFLHTTVDDGDHFQQILAWTLKSRWQNPERFRGCVKSP